MPSTASLSFATATTLLTFAEEEEQERRSHHKANSIAHSRLTSGIPASAVNKRHSGEDNARVRLDAAWQESPAPPVSHGHVGATAPPPDPTSYAPSPAPSTASASSSRGLSAEPSIISEVHHGSRSQQHNNNNDGNRRTRASERTGNPSARAISPSLAPPSLSADAQARVAAVLRNGSPRTRGMHSINPMAPNASRAPPLEVQGPPRYLRARGLTPSPAAAPAASAPRNRRASHHKKHQQQGGEEPPREPRRRRRSSNTRKHGEEKRHSSSSSSSDSRHKSVHEDDAANRHGDTKTSRRPSHSEVKLLWAEQYPDQSRAPPPSRRQTLPPHIPSPAHLYEEGENYQLPPPRTIGSSNAAGVGGRIDSAWTQQAQTRPRAPPQGPRSPGSRRPSAVLDPGQGTDAMQLTVPQLTSHGGPGHGHAAASPPPFPNFELNRPTSLYGGLPSQQQQQKGAVSKHRAPIALHTHTTSNITTTTVATPESHALNTSSGGTAGVASRRFAVPVSTASVPPVPPQQQPQPQPWPPHEPTAAASTSPAMPSNSPIARTYVAHSFSSYLPGESTVLLGSHNRGAAAATAASASAGAVPASPRPLHPTTRCAMADIEVAMVAGALAELPAPPVLEHYEDMLRCWHTGQVAHSTATAALTRDDARCRYTEAEVAATFDLVLHLCVPSARTTGTSHHDVAVVVGDTAPSPGEAVTVRDIKDEVERRTGVPAAQLCLVYDAMSLQDCLPVHLLMLATDGEQDGDGDGNDSDGFHDAHTSVRRGRRCLRLVCVPLQRPSMSAAGRRRSLVVTSPLGARPDAETSVRETRTSTTATDALRSLMLLSPTRRRATPQPTAAAGPVHRPGAVPFVLSTGGAAPPPLSTLDTEQRVQDHISRLRSRYLEDARQPAAKDLTWTSSHVDPVTATSRIPPPPPSTSTVVQQQHQHHVLLSALLNTGHTAADGAVSVVPADVSRGYHHQLRGRTALSDALIAALPAPPTRHATPTALPSPAVKSGVASSMSTAAVPPTASASAKHPPSRPSWPTGQRLRDADVLALISADAAAAGSDGGGVDASWMEPLSVLSSHLEPPAAPVMQPV